MRYILCGLGQEYESVIVNLTSRKDKLSLEEVQYMLQTQEMRIKQLISVYKIEVNSTQANVANIKRIANYGSNGGN